MMATTRIQTAIGATVIEVTVIEAKAKGAKATMDAIDKTDPIDPGTAAKARTAKVATAKTFSKEKTAMKAHETAPTGQSASSSGKRLTLIQTTGSTTAMIPSSFSL